MPIDHATCLAYHEAAHTVTTMLFGGLPSEVATVPSDEHGTSGHVKHGPPRFCDPVRNAKASMLVALVGPACDARLDDCHLGNRGWYGGRPPWWFNMDLPDLCKDGADALAEARNVTTSEGMAWRLMDTVAGWADELLDVPRVWGSVAALADRLHPRVVLSGAEAIRIVVDAWGGDCITPRHLGRRWTRRFF